MLNKLKSEKGITLISLIVYITVMLIVITIVGTITSYFYSNVNDQYQESKDENNENTLNMYLANDFKNQIVTIKTLDLKDIPSEGSSSINATYDDSNSIIYTITGDGIYRNSVKIYNIENNDEMRFFLGNKLTSTTDSKIYEKQELRIEKIIEGQENEVFKTYMINTKPKAIYETTSEN